MKGFPDTIKRAILRYALPTLLLAFLLFLCPSAALAEDGDAAAPAAETTADTGAGDVADAPPTAAVVTATVAVHNVTSEVDIPAALQESGSAATDTTDLMETHTPSDIAANYTFDNEPVAAVPNPDVEGQNLIEANADNAIQRAVDKALSNLTATSTDVVISVKDGSYEGGVNIILSADKQALLNNARVTVAAADALTVTHNDQGTVRSTDFALDTESAGNVKVSGDIVIEGIDVVLAGIYLSINSTIKAKNSELTVYGTQLGDTVNVELTGADSSLTVESGAGADNVTVTMPKTNVAAPADAPESVTVHTGDGNDSVSISGKAPAGDVPTAIAIDTGAGDDSVTISTSLANMSDAVTVDAGTGSGDRIHFTGALKETQSDTEDNAAHTHDAVKKTETFDFTSAVTNASGNKILSVETKGFDSYTDELTNKHTVTITKIAGGKLYRPDEAFTESTDDDTPISAFKSFTDYVFVGAVLDHAIDLGGNGSAGSIWLSNLKFANNDLTVKESINAPALNLSFFGKRISFDNTEKKINIVGNTVTVTALDSDTQFGVDYKQHETKTDTYDVAFSFFDVVSQASIYVGTNASLESKGGAIVLNATTSQVKGMVDIAGATGSLNFVNVKVGSATITLDGKLTAKTSVTAASSGKVSLSTSNSVLSAAFIPLAVSVIVLDAGVTVGRTAVIEAVDAGVSLTAKTNVTVKSAASTGKLPVSLAVSAVVADAYVDVYGQIVAETVNEGNVTATATANSSVTTTADKGTGKAVTNVFGGFFAFGVVVQNARAMAYRDEGWPSPSITAGGNVGITANSDERVTTSATSAAPASAAEGGTGEGGTLSGVKALAMGVVDAVDAQFQLKAKAGELAGTFKEKALSAFSTIKNKIQGKAGAVIKSDETENGAVSAPTKAAPGANVTVSVTPSEGYKADKVAYRHLKLGMKDFETEATVIAKNDAGKYVFAVPTDAAAVIISAIFVTGSENPGEEDYGLTDLFSEEEESLGLEELFNEGTSGAGGDAGTAWYHNPHIAASGYTVDEYFLLGNGAVLSDAAKTAVGETVRLLINPAKGMQYQKDSLKVVTGGVEIKLKKINDVEYSFTMPSSNVRVEAAFEKASDESKDSEDGGGSASAQVTGALAVTVAVNDNNAYVDSARTDEVVIVAPNGAVNIKAVGTTQAKTTADGSPVGAAAADAPAAGADAGTGTDGTGKSYGEQTLSGTAKPVTIAATFNGRLARANAADPAKVAISVTPDTGYQLVAADGVTASYYNRTSDELQTVKLTLGSDEKYILTLTGLDVRDDTVVTVSAKFAEKLHSILFGSITGGTASASITEARAGQEVTLTIQPDSGRKVKAVTGVTPQPNLPAGVYKFDMPDANVAIGVSFEAKATPVNPVSITKDGTEVSPSELSGYAQYIVFSDIRVDEGDILTYTPGPKATGEGLKLAVQYSTDGSTWTELPKTGWTVTNVPGDVKIKVALTGKPITINYVSAPSGKGTVSGAVRADSAEKLVFTVAPASGMQIAELKIKVNSGTSAKETVVKAVGGVYSYTLPVYTDDFLRTNAVSVTVTGTFAAGSGESAVAKKSVSLGVGVAVSVTHHENNAYVRRGIVESASLSIKAISGTKQTRVISTASSKSGYSSGDIGVGGVITVHVASIKTRAALCGGAAWKYTSGGAGDLEIEATANEWLQTNASSVSTEKSGSVGVGASIAVAVMGVDTVAGVDKNAVIVPKNHAADKLNNVTVNAGNVLNEAIESVAGSAGGISVTPVLALDVSGAFVNAFLQPGANALSLSGDAKVTASSSSTREAAANAAASGGSVGVGGSFVITVLNDSAASSIQRSIIAKNVTVKSTARSALKSTSRAGSNGAAASGGASASSGTGTDTGSDDEGSLEEGESDQQADGALDSASGLMGMGGGTGSSRQSLLDGKTDRQKAETSEGSVQIAAGFNLNIQTNRAVAFIDDGVTVVAGGTGSDGLLSITTENDTDANVVANASATKAKIGVGVAVAINVVTYENTAYIGKAKITANHLTLSATMAPIILKKVVTQKPAQDNIVTLMLKSMLDQLVRDLLESMGVDASFAEGLATVEWTLRDGAKTRDIVEYIVDQVAYILGSSVQTLAEEAGLEKLLSANIEGMERSAPGDARALDGAYYIIEIEPVVYDAATMPAAWADGKRIFRIRVYMVIGGKKIDVTDSIADMDVSFLKKESETVLYWDEKTGEWVRADAADGGAVRFAPSGVFALADAPDHT